MPVIRRHAVQGKPNTPLAVGRMPSPRPPFPSELFTANPRAEEQFPRGDSLHEAYDDVRYFRCKECGDIMPELEMNEHICYDDAWELRQTTHYGEENDY